MNYDPEPPFELVVALAIVFGLVILVIWVLLIPVWALRWAFRRIRA